MAVCRAGATSLPPRTAFAIRFSSLQEPAKSVAETTNDSAPSKLEIPILVIALSLAFAALLYNIVSEPLDHGYTRYGSIAWHMVATGDYVVPRLGDQIYILKPPLQSWMIALGIELVGAVPNWVTHIPNLLGATASIAATWFLARRLLNSARGATLAALVLASFSTFVEHSRGERVDPLFADSLVTAITFFHAAMLDDGKRVGRELAAMWLSLVVALLTKGPFGIIFFLAVTLPYAISIGKAKLFLSRTSVMFALVAFAITAIWPCLLIHRLGWDEVVRVFQMSEFTKQAGGPLFYLSAIPLSIVPWAIFLPALAFFLGRAKPWSDSLSLRLPCIWIGIFVVALHLSMTRHERYLLPILAPLAILLAAMAIHSDPLVQRVTRWTGIVGAVGIAAIAGGVRIVPPQVFDVPAEFSTRSVVVLFFAAAALYEFLRQRPVIHGTLRLGLACLLMFALRDVYDAKKMMKMDGRKEAIAELLPTLREHTVYSHVSVDYEKLGMIEMIVRHELPRLPRASPSALAISEVIDAESGQSLRPKGLAPGDAFYVLASPTAFGIPADLQGLGETEVVAKLELDETKFVLVRCRTS